MEKVFKRQNPEVQIRQKEIVLRTNNFCFYFACYSQANTLRSKGKQLLEESCDLKQKTPDKQPVLSHAA